MIVDTATLQARPAGYLHDLATVARRALRQLPREPAPLVVAIFIPAFFYTTNIGMFANLVRQGGGISYKAYLVPMAVAFAVTGTSRAPMLVTDITPQEMVEVQAQEDPAGRVATSVTLKAALVELSPRQRAVVVLRCLADLSTAEVADALRCAPGTVEATLHVGLKRLKIDLEKGDLE